MTAIDRSTAMIPQSDSERQSAIRRRLDEIWVAAAARDFDAPGVLPPATAPASPRSRTVHRAADAASNAAGERAMFSALEGPAVDMRDLTIAVYGDVGLVTFNGHFTAAMHGSAVALDQQVTMVLVDDGDWKIVHEHFSPLAVT